MTTPSPVYSTICTFPSSVGLIDATNGWDAAYAVGFATINQDLAQRQPWLAIDEQGTAGSFMQPNPPSGLLFITGTLSGLTVIRGGSGGTVRLMLSIADATLSGADGAVAGQSFDVGIDVNLLFQAGSQPGLNNLVVNTAGSMTVSSVASSTMTLSVVQQAELTALMTDFIARQSTLFTAVFANVFTKDFAQSVNIPWLTPSAFAYAVTDMANAATPYDGILAVLAKADGNTAGLSAQFDADAFPTNPGVNAAVAIASNTVADDTFLTTLNGILGPNVANFAYDPQQGVLKNVADIDLEYRIDSTDNTVQLITSGALADSQGSTFPTTIPAGSLQISLQNGAITVSITPANVDLGQGYTLVLTMNSSYQFMIDQGTQELDLVLAGTPSIKSNLVAPDQSSTGAVLMDIGTTIGGIAIGEILPVVFDWVFGALTNVGLTTAKLNQYTLNFFAAMNQARDTGEPVSFSIGAMRQIVVGTDLSAFREGQQAPTPLSAAYQNSLLLPDLLSIPATVPESLVPPAAASVFNSLAKSLQGNANLLSALISACKGQDITDTLGNALTAYQSANLPANAASLKLVPNANGQAGAYTLNVPNGASIPLEVADLDGLYQGCANFLKNQLNGNAITASIYAKALSGAGVQQLIAAVKSANAAQAAGAAADPDGANPGSEMQPLTGRAGGNQDGAAGQGNNAPANNGQAGDNPLNIEVTTTVAGNIVDPPLGYFRDLIAAQDSDREGNVQNFVVNLIRDVQKPFVLKVVGAALYVGGLVAGFFLDKVVGNVLPNPEQTGVQQGAVANQVTAAAVTQPADLLFGDVTFPMMTRFVDGGTTGPAPANVLQCAAVNGGVIFGVAIATDQT